MFYNQGFVTLSFIHGFSDFRRKATKLGGRVEGGEGAYKLLNLKQKSNKQTNKKNINKSKRAKLQSRR